MKGKSPASSPIARAASCAASDLFLRSKRVNKVRLVLTESSNANCPRGETSSSLAIFFRLYLSRKTLNFLGIEFIGVAVIIKIAKNVTMTRISTVTAVPTALFNEALTHQPTQPAASRIACAP